MDYSKITVSEFIKMFPKSYIQTFDDQKERKDKSLTQLMPIKSVTIEQLQALNQRGAGIFFTPNPCKGGRKEENIESIKWAYVDLDEGEKEGSMLIKIVESPLQPSIIIESKRGYHVYFRCDIKKENWNKIIQGLIQYFDGDTAISSINEVLRVPFFYHMKDKDNPFLVKLASLKKNKYSEAELIKAFPYVTFKQQFKTSFGDNLDDVKNIPIRSVLSRLGVETKGNSILEAGRVTSMMINTKENYINRFSGKQGGGSTIDVVMCFKELLVKDAIDWLRTEFKLKKSTIIIPEKPKKKHHDVLKEKVIKNLYAGTIAPFTWGTNCLNDNMTLLQRGDYVVLVGETGSGKTTYSLFMARENAKRGLKVLFFSFEMTVEGLITRYARDRSQITKDQWKNASFTEIQKQNYIDAIDELDNVHFYDLQEKTIANIETAITGDVDMVFIDNLGFLEASGEEENVRRETISRQIVELCKKRPNTCVIILHHFRKGAGKTPRTLDDIRGTGKISHDSTCVIQYWRDRENAEKGTWIILHKDRQWGMFCKAPITYKNAEFIDSLNQNQLNRVFNKKQ